MREAAAGIRDTKEAGKRKKRYETAKRNLDSDVCGDNAGDADGAVCESARPATTQAMQMEQYARAHGLPGRMIPVPREITAGCGLSWKAAPEEGKEILAALQTAGLAYEAEYRVLL